MIRDQDIDLRAAAVAQAGLPGLVVFSSTTKGTRRAWGQPVARRSVPVSYCAVALKSSALCEKSFPFFVA